MIFLRVPYNSMGAILYPLNELRDRLPHISACDSIFADNTSQLFEISIPFLNRTWRDVLHFSTVNPRLMRDALVQLGYRWRRSHFFAVDPRANGFDESNAVIFDGRLESYPLMSVEHFLPFNMDALRAYRQLPKLTMEYYQRAMACRDPLAMFHYVPQVLYTGKIDVDNLTMIEV